MDDTSGAGDAKVDLKTKKTTIGEMASRNYAVVNKALMKYNGIVRYSYTDVYTDYSNLKVAEEQVSYGTKKD